jgi:MiaB-like tRNA modifying enzyme
MRVFLKTFGCTLNNADSDALRASLLESGHSFAESASEADVAIVSTCAVKGATEAKMLCYLRSISAEGRGVIVAGCLPHVALDRVRTAAPNAKAILGVDCAPKIPRILDRISDGDGVETIVDLSGKPEEKFSLKRCHDGVVARIPVAYGCLGSCSYCCVKHARGTLKSVPITEVLKQVERAVSNGAREVQVTAQDCGCYGLDAGSSTAELLRALDSVEGEFFIRVGMMNPNHVLRQLDELVEAFKSKKAYKFLHVPLQSGSDRVLKAMKREYLAQDFREITEAFRREFPEALVATDVIAGFPGETEDDFRRTVELLEEVKPDMTNVSKFSPRPGAEASGAKQLPHNVVNERSAIISGACRAIALEKNKALVGRRYRVVVTEKAKGAMLARNENYKPVLVKNARLGDFADVEIRGAGAGYLKAF